MDLTSHRLQVAKALSDLEEAIADLVNALAHGDVTVTLEPSDGGTPIRRACNAYSAIDYQLEDAVGASVVCLGVLGASPDILKRANTVNAMKNKFKAICAPLHGIRIRIPVKGEASPIRAIQAIRVILRNIQRSDLNLLAAYRKIPILDAPPASITYTRANTRAVYRKTVDEIYQLLINAEGATASADRARLETLERRETHLAFVKDHYRNIRANIVYARLDRSGRGRRQIAAELPIVYVQGRAVPPTVEFPSPESDAIKAPRIRQAQLEAVPFLDSIPVYRYSR